MTDDDQRATIAIESRNLPFSLSLLAARKDDEDIGV